ncbi:PDZ domain-containing protein [Streptomyces sp. NPDC046939]|uniref:PDZ domain-containing protein n=1 Tax=Streptomyces sp. NPDC046939 TaxID=3155376 RepID=UPI0033F155F7
MERTALRPRSMPGTAGAGSRRPDVVRGGGGRRTAGLLAGLLCALALVLAGAGLGAVGTTVLGLSGLSDMSGARGTSGASDISGAGKAAGVQQRPQEKAMTDARPAEKAPARTILGVEVADAPQGPGALVVAVHVPGPGYTAGLVRGDVVTRFGAVDIGSARALVARVANARPGRQVLLVVRHRDGVRQTLAVTPGLVT